MRSRRQQADTSSLLSQWPIMYGFDPIFFPGIIVFVDAIEQTGSVADSVWKNIRRRFRQAALRELVLQAIG